MSMNQQQNMMEQISASLGGIDESLKGIYILLNAGGFVENNIAQITSSIEKLASTLDYSGLFDRQFSELASSVSQISNELSNISSVLYGISNTVDRLGN